jgi:hypothetical protein
MSNLIGDYIDSLIASYEQAPLPTSVPWLPREVARQDQNIAVIWRSISAISTGLLVIERSPMHYVHSRLRTLLPPLSRGFRAVSTEFARSNNAFLMEVLGSFL